MVTRFNSFRSANPVATLAAARPVTKPKTIVVGTAWGDPDDMEAASLIAASRPLLPHQCSARTAIAATVRTHNVTRSTISQLTVPDKTTALAVR